MRTLRPAAAALLVAGGLLGSGAGTAAAAPADFHPTSAVFRGDVNLDGRTDQYQLGFVDTRAGTTRCGIRIQAGRGADDFQRVHVSRLSSLPADTVCPDRGAILGTPTGGRVVFAWSSPPPNRSATLAAVGTQYFRVPSDSTPVPRDVDGDAWDDVEFVSAAGSHQVMVRAADGSYRPQAYVDAPGDLEFLADLNRNGGHDYVADVAQNGVHSVRLVDGHTGTKLVLAEGSDRPLRVTTLDLNGDLYADLEVTRLDDDGPTVIARFENTSRIDTFSFRRVPSG